MSVAHKECMEKRWREEAVREGSKELAKME